ncbi:MAG: FAD-binding oxidoreductase, partial [Chitinophagaceae bacterium]
FLAPADVIIAGAGFAGLWSALHLKTVNPDLSILICEKELIPSGASTRNAGFACFGSLTELVDDLAFMGEVRMKEMVELRFKGLIQIRENFEDTEIDYQQLGGYELISKHQYPDHQSMAEDINQINALLQQITGEPAVFSNADEKLADFGFGNTGHLVENRLEGQLHAGKLMRRLMQKVRLLGVEIFHGVGIAAFKNIEGYIDLTTSSGIHLQAKRLIISTNALAGQLSQHLSITPARGQVLLTTPIAGLPFGGCFHYDEGYYYFRNLDGRVLLGGARNVAFAEEETTEMNTTKTIQDELERFLREVVIPGKEFSIEKRWSGIMGMAETKFPVVREIEPNVFCATGLGGIGIAIAPEVGRMVAALMIN